MPKLLDSKTFIQFFELDGKKETDGLSARATDKWLMWKQPDITESLLKWAEDSYPSASHLDHCSFAGLVAYFATGGYGGYGTVNVQKERFAEQKAYGFYNHLYDKLSAEDMTIAMIWFVASHILQKAPMEDEKLEKIKRAIRLLEDSKSSFKSKQIAEARKILEEVF